MLVGSSEPARSARVPLHIVRLLPPLLLVVSLIIAWRQSEWRSSHTNSLFVPAASFVSVQWYGSCADGLTLMLCCLACNCAVWCTGKSLHVIAVVGCGLLFGLVLRWASSC